MKLKKSKSHTKYADIKSFITKDKSIIRELMHPQQHAVSAQSLAEAIVPVGTETLLHKHNQSEELYHITQGNGVMRLGEQVFLVNTGDTICIKPGTPHNIRNAGEQALRILCVCSPAYADSDTEVLS